jgi:ABC-type amino acid transport system permease subunit
MSGSTRTGQVTLGIRQVGVTIVAAALAIVLAVVLGFGLLTATKSQTDSDTGAPVVTHQGSGGSNGTNFAQ